MDNKYSLSLEISGSLPDSSENVVSEAVFKWVDYIFR